jgi:hypothetical protein
MFNRKKNEVENIHETDEDLIRFHSSVILDKIGSPQNCYSVTLNEIVNLERHLLHTNDADSIYDVYLQDVAQVQITYLLNAIQKRDVDLFFHLHLSRGFPLHSVLFTQACHMRRRVEDCVIFDFLLVHHFKKTNCWDQAASGILNICFLNENFEDASFLLKRFHAVLSESNPSDDLKLTVYAGLIQHACRENKFDLFNFAFEELKCPVNTAIAKLCIRRKSSNLLNHLIYHLGLKVNNDLIVFTLKEIYLLIEFSSSQIVEDTNFLYLKGTLITLLRICTLDPEHSSLDFDFKISFRENVLPVGSVRHEFLSFYSTYEEKTKNVITLAIFCYLGFDTLSLMLKAGYRFDESSLKQLFCRQYLTKTCSSTQTFVPISNSFNSPEEMKMLFETCFEENITIKNHPEAFYFLACINLPRDLFNLTRTLFFKDLTLSAKNIEFMVYTLNYQKKQTIEPAFVEVWKRLVFFQHNLSIDESTIYWIFHILSKFHSNKDIYIYEMINILPFRNYLENHILELVSILDNGTQVLTCLQTILNLKSSTTSILMKETSLDFYVSNLVAEFI